MRGDPAAIPSFHISDWLAKIEYFPMRSFDLKIEYFPINSFDTAIITILYLPIIVFGVQSIEYFSSISFDWKIEYLPIISLGHNSIYSLPHALTVGSIAV